MTACHKPQLLVTHNIICDWICVKGSFIAAYLRSLPIVELQFQTFVRKLSYIVKLMKAQTKYNDSSKLQN